MPKPRFVDLIEVTTAREMFEAVTALAGEQDIIVKAAAVADYRPREVKEEKIKKSDTQMSLEMEKTDDIFEISGGE